MIAVVLAGGKGSRLSPLTDNLPKPMVNIIGTPIIDYILRYLKSSGIDEVRLALGYMAKDIIGHVGNGERYDLKVTYFVEDEPLGTAGCVRWACKDIKEDFFVISGDAFFDISLTEMWQQHINKDSLATLALKYMDNIEGFGVVALDNEGMITQFIEKPMESENKLVNTGIYILQPKLLEYIPDGFYDFGRQLFPRLLNQMNGYIANGYWNDVGTLQKYYETNLYVTQHLQKYEAYLN